MFKLLNPAHFTSGLNTASKALIYPARSVSGYGHIYSLGIAGIPITALSRINCENFHSRFIGEKYIIADPHDDPQKFINWLVRYGSRQVAKPVLFMAEDPYAYIISIHQEQLRPFFHFPFIPLETIDIYFNKRAMYTKAVEAGLRIPKTVFSPINKDIIKNWKAYPAVIKPVVSRFNYSGNVFGSIRTFPDQFGCKAWFAKTPTDLADCVDRVKNAGLDFCIQEYILGDNSCLCTIYFVADTQARIPSFSTHYKVRQYPADFGTTSVSQSRSIPILHEYAEWFCKTTGYSGPATMEFKQSDSDGLWYLMEINPRLGFSVRRSTVKGVNMPLQQYLLSTGQKLLNCKQTDDRSFWIDIPGDLKGLLWRRGKRQWCLPLMHVVKPYLNFHEAVLNLIDPIPGSLRFLSYARHLSKKHWRGSS
jgi:predicted ATP-grasp superfamily ATP-dependent carboligase